MLFTKKNLLLVVCVSLLLLISLTGCAGLRKNTPLTAEQAAEGYHFNDRTFQGWEPRGEAKLSISRKLGKGDSTSLLVSDRSETWNGAMVNVIDIVKPDTLYSISAYVRLAEGMPASRLVLTMERTPVDGDTYFDWIAPSEEKGVTQAQWTLLSGEYSFQGEAESLYLYLESPDEELVDFYIDAVYIRELESLVIPVKEPQMDIPSVAETYQDKFLIGAAIEPYQLESEYHAQLLTRHFNSITAENVMKPIMIQPEEGEFTWKSADKLVEFAKENGLAVHGHTLVWHNQAAEWMFKDEDGQTLEATPENKELVLSRLETHIRAIVGRYKGYVQVWDAVNEVIDNTQSDCLRHSVWYDLTGIDYIITAFNVAHEVDPDAVLLINDYNLTDESKRACMVKVVKELQAQGVPVDGIGMQMHINVIVPSGAEIEESIEAYAELGEVHITEMDMSLYNNDNDAYESAPRDVIIEQGYRYKEVFEALNNQADNLGSVTFWGMADDHTWLKTWPKVRLNLPLLFDEQLQAKPAYWGVVDPSQLPILIKKVSIQESTPEIDGQAETLWITQSWLPVTPEISYQARWDENNLYLFVKSIGKPLEDRIIDVFIDEGDDKTGTPDHVYRFAGGKCTNCENVTLAMAVDDDGSYLEAAIPLDNAVAAKDLIGFDIRISDLEGTEPFSWNDKSHNQEISSENYGSLKLIEAARLTFAIRGTPVIDGEEDEIWADAHAETTTVWVVGSSGSTAVVRTMWDDEYLYFYAQVTDALLSKASANNYEQDSLEVYVDQNNGKTTSYEPDDGQYRINFDNEHSFGGYGSEDRLISATRVTDTGYVVELAIKLDSVTPQPGMIIGYDFQVNNDEDGDGVRDSVVTWNDPTHQTYLNLSRTGLLMLMD
ncbi:MAG: endo-1,4-beta-xylanase [Anaerolineales bacterium]